MKRAQIGTLRVLGLLLSLCLLMLSPGRSWAQGEDEAIDDPALQLTEDEQMQAYLADKLNSSTFINFESDLSESEQKELTSVATDILAGSPTNAYKDVEAVRVPPSPANPTGGIELRGPEQQVRSARLAIAPQIQARSIKMGAAPASLVKFLTLERFGTVRGLQDLITQYLLSNGYSTAGDWESLGSSQPVDQSKTQLPIWRLKAKGPVYFRLESAEIKILQDARSEANQQDKLVLDQELPLGILLQGSDAKLTIVITPSIADQIQVVEGLARLLEVQQSPKAIVPSAAAAYSYYYLNYLEVEEALRSMEMAGFAVIYRNPKSLSDGVKSTEGSVDKFVSGAAFPARDGFLKEADVKLQDSPVTFPVPQSTATGIGKAGVTLATFKSVMDPPGLAQTSSGELNGLVIKYRKGDEAKVREIADFLSLIDVPAAQLQLEALVYDVDRDQMRDLGLRELSLDENRFDIGQKLTPENPFGFFTYDDGPMSGQTGSLLAKLSLLESHGQAELLARPSVNAVDGRQSTISLVQYLGTAKGATTDLIPVGLTLNLRPRVIHDTEEPLIQLWVNASLSSLNSVNPLNSEDFQFSISSREVSTLARVKNNQAIVLGGLINEETTRRRSGLPGLSQIPLLGDLFSRTSTRKRKRETIIAIRPVLLDDDRPNGNLFRRFKKHPLDEPDQVDSVIDGVWFDADAIARAKKPRTQEGEALQQDIAPKTGQRQVLLKDLVDLLDPLTGKAYATGGDLKNNLGLVALPQAVNTAWAIVREWGLVGKAPGSTPLRKFLEPLAAEPDGLPPTGGALGNIEQDLFPKKLEQGELELTDTEAEKAAAERLKLAALKKAAKLDALETEVAELIFALHLLRENDCSWPKFTCPELFLLEDAEPLQLPGTDQFSVYLRGFLRLLDENVAEEAPQQSQLKERCIEQLKKTICSGAQSIGVTSCKEPVPCGE